tara:strand:+ start:110 stop:571 length:462 start_codon:yes stop_codon:yes gene_type:complete
MGIIKPTLSLTANASSATTEAGPLSFAISLSATDSLDVTQVESKIIDISTTHALIFDHDNYFATNADTGIDGGFVYFKNLLAENAPADLLHDIVIHNTDATALGQDHEPRLFTLQPGEFAWMPWDFTWNFYADGAESNSNALECWLFVRTTTV